MPEYKPFHRCVESQAHAPLRLLTDTQDEYEFLESFVEDSKPAYLGLDGYDLLVQTPFRYKLPVPNRFAARFRPGFFHKNVFYASKKRDTSLYEASYYFLRQRHYIEGLSQTPEPRTLFVAGVNLKGAADLRSHPEIEKIMDRNDYGASHHYMEANRDTEVLLYPSCRCPNRGTNVAVFKIGRLEKKPTSQETLTFVYDSGKKAVRIFGGSGKELMLIVHWKEVT